MWNISEISQKVKTIKNYRHIFCYSSSQYAETKNDWKMLLTLGVLRNFMHILSNSIECLNYDAEINLQSWNCFYI